VLNTDREAKRLMSDPSSWSQGGVRRRAFRQMQLTPDEEVPRGRARRRKKQRHVHKWGEWKPVGQEIRRVGWGKNAPRHTVYKWVRSCKKCGYRDNGYSSDPRGRQMERSRWHW
jgi:hypothetical protein